MPAATRGAIRFRVYLNISQRQVTNSQRIVPKNDTHAFAAGLTLYRNSSNQPSQRGDSNP